ncbi:MAG: ADP-ribosylglycohydrolase family protein [Eubacteriales bacterium]
MDTNIINKSYGKRHWWDEYCEGLGIEYRQCIEEGRDIESLKPLFDAVSTLPLNKDKDELSDVLFRMILKAPMREEYSFEEPDGIEDIRKLSHCDTDVHPEMPDREQLKEKISGAWTGRVCGCLLGKPIEGFSKEKIRRILASTGNYPMRGYIKRSSLEAQQGLDADYPYKGINSFVDMLNGYAPADDDINYTVMAQRTVELFGRGFSSSNVKSIWLALQGRNAYCTAERVAYINFINGYEPHESALYKNPFREWIGAQIRGDYFGYINPCDIYAAAEMAWRDARISHVKNGIYGEMFVAAMVAAAAGKNAPEPAGLIRLGLSVIPATSRLHHALSDMLRDFEGGTDFEGAVGKIYSEYDDHSRHDWCHVIPNAKIVCAALLYGGGDYSDSICKAVQCGFDTDCNGATVGSVLGMRNGIDGIDKRWYEPISKGFETSIFGSESCSFSEATELTLRHIEQRKG